MTDQPALATMVIQANPVPDPVATAEHLDAYQSLLALIDERSGAMDHHTLQADTPANTPPPPARNRAAAWAFAAAFILILIVVGAAALLLRGDDAQVTDEPAPPTTANVDNSRGERPGPELDTLTWTKTDFNLEMLGVFSLDSLTFDPEHGYWLWHRGGLWESDDGMSWRFVDVPTEFGDYTVDNLAADGGETGASPGFGLASSNQGSYALLSWQDGAWVEVGQLETPDTVGIEWNLELAAPIESGGVLVARGGWTGSLPWGDIYGHSRKPGCTVCGYKPPRQRWDAAAETVHIVDPFDGSVLASLAFEVVGDTATFRDAATGAVVHEVVGSADCPINDYPIKRLMRGHKRANVDGIWVGAPGADFEFHDPGLGRVLAVPDGSGFVAYEHGNNGVRTLMSADAVTWNEGTAPPFGHAPPSWRTPVRIASRGGEIVALVGSIRQDLGTQFTQFWVSPDGVTWTQKALPASYDDYDWARGPYPTEFGYVAWPLEGGLLYWLSVDGESWIEAPGPTGHDGTSSTVAGSTLFWADEIDDLGNALWVGHFQP